jgi:BASS family bile acid:Na+ symporter
VTIHNPVIQIFLPIAVVVVMFALGTTLTVLDLRRVLKRPRAFFLGLLAHSLLLPLLAFAIAVLLPLPGALAVGLVLIASCPANSVANVFTHLARGDTMLSVCLTAGASLTSVVTVPLFVNTAFRAFPAGHTAVHLPVVATAVSLFAVSSVPVVGGMILRRRRPAVAHAVEKRMGAVGLAVVAVVIVIAVWSERRNVLPALASAGGPALLLNTLSVSLAWGAAALFGLDVRQRVAVGLECGLQNFAMAAFVALTLLSDTSLLLPAIAYGLTMYLSAGAAVLVARRATPVTGPRPAPEVAESLQP